MHLERDEDGKQPREQGHCPVVRRAPVQSSQCRLSGTITFYPVLRTHLQPQLEEEGSDGQQQWRNPLSCFLNGHNTTLGSKHIFL